MRGKGAVLIGLGTDTGGTLYGVTSSGPAAGRSRHTDLWTLAGRTWVHVHGWAGKEVVGACSAGGWVLCPALHSVLYACRLRDGEWRQVALPGGREAEVSACAAIDDATVLLGGGGPTGLLFVTVPELAVTRQPLSQFGVSRPGRTVRAMARIGGRVYLGGAKNLLAVYDGGAVRELTTRSSFPTETMVSAVAAVGETAYVVGFSSAAGHALYAVEGGAARRVDLPFEPGRVSAPGLRAWGDDLLVYHTTLYRGVPGRWARWGGNFVADRGVVAAATLPGEDAVCVGCADGRSFLVGRDGAEPLGVA